MNPYLILVNKTYPVPQDYLSHVKLVWTCGANDQRFLIERQTLAAYEALAAYIKETENIIIGAGNSYRSFEMQQQIYDQSAAMLWVYFALVGAILGLVILILQKAVFSKWAT